MFTHPFSGAVVGTIHNPKALAAALQLSGKVVDFLEVRIDGFSGAAGLAALEKALPELKVPLLITVRHPLEGGGGSLTLAQRRALFARFLPYASLVDVELRSAKTLKNVISQAQSQGIGVVLSHHDFQKTPSPARLQVLRNAAARAGCDIFKVATVARTPRDLVTLLDFLTARSSAALPLAVMGMGEFGKISRLALGKSGSVLNYGYLDKPQVPGQWPAVLLKERLREC